MKIIFDSEQERKDVALELARASICPNNLDFEERECYSECIACWERALEKEEVRKNGV